MHSHYNQELFEIMEILKIPMCIFLLLFCYFAEANQKYLTSSYSIQAVAYTASRDGNSLYLADGTEKIYRFNHTSVLNSPSFIYATNHTGSISAMAVSISEVYLASGSSDYTILVHLAHTNQIVCSFTHGNQIRALIFDPNFEAILYAASIDDVIKKWNITGCSLIAEKSVGFSISTMAINQAGTFLAYGTIEGHVGTIDSSLASPSTKTGAHQFTVLKIIYSNNDYYASFGQDSVAKLWKSGSIISTSTSITISRILNCDQYIRQVADTVSKFVGCLDQQKNLALIKITNTSISLISNKVTDQLHHLAIFKHLEYPEQQWLLNFQANISTYYVFNGPSSICTSYFGRDAALKVCNFCYFFNAGCQTCTSNTFCTSCSLGFYLNSSNLCSKCPMECSTCTDSNTCLICAVNYVKIGGSNQCSLKSSPISGCYRLQSNNCLMAANQYFLSGTNLKSCTVTHAACLQCLQINGDCITCKTGYYVNGTTCSSCDFFIPGCLSCSNNTNCILCAVSHKTVSGVIVCSNCFPTCLTCAYFYTDCLTCYAAQNRQLINNSCYCKIGYYENLPNYTCLLCNATLSNCYQCSDGATCTQCLPFFYYVTHAGVKECEVCNKYCQTCYGTSTNCSSCNNGTHHRKLSNSTCICQINFVSISGGIPCVSCAIMNKGCTACINETYCTACSPGYYLKIYSSSKHLCSLCPYYCLTCSLNASNIICTSCVAGTYRTLVSGMCQCNSGYFDDNQTQVCEKCLDFINNCRTCFNRTKCSSCLSNLLIDTSLTLCAPCLSTCLTCLTYFDQCSSCNTSMNRILNNHTCICSSSTYEKSGICTPCSSAIKNCNECKSQNACTGCESGYTLYDFRSCINCNSQMNGCLYCSSKTHCLSCESPFTKINNHCRCPMNQYTSKQNWGNCKNYHISDLNSSLGVELMAHQHQNNSLHIFIRFRANKLHLMNNTNINTNNINTNIILENSIQLAINQLNYSITFDFVDNNRIYIRTELSAPLSQPNVTIMFSENIFYDQNLLSPWATTHTVSPARLYHSTDFSNSYNRGLKICIQYAMIGLKWVFFILTFLGLGHIVFPFMFFMQLIPIFLLLNMSLPGLLSAILEGALTLQIPSVVPFSIFNSKYFVLFPPLTYDYYEFKGFILLEKLSDILLISIISALIKFDDGIVRMFSSGKIRQYLYDSLVLRGYSVLSLCILSLQTPLILHSSAFIKARGWENKEQIFNYCCCILIFGFYLVYNFNHASNLQATEMKINIQNKHCFFNLNPQNYLASKTILFVLFTNFWLAGALPLIGPMLYFILSIALLSLRFFSHFVPSFYTGKIQFALKQLQNIFLLIIYFAMFIFYLGQQNIELSHAQAQSLGLMAVISIGLYFLICLIEKVAQFLDFQIQWKKAGKIENLHGHEIVYAQKIDSNYYSEDFLRNELANLRKVEKKK